MAFHVRLPWRPACAAALSLAAVLLCAACERRATGENEPDAARAARLQAAQPEPNSPFYALTYEDALLKARLDGKAVLVDFYTVTCKPCKQLERETFADARVRAWLHGRTITIKVNADDRKDLVQRYAVYGYPTLVFTRPDGAPVGQIAGFKSPDDFLASAAGILPG